MQYLHLVCIFGASLASATPLGLYGNANLPIDPGNDSDTRGVFNSLSETFGQVLRDNIANGVSLLANETSFSFAVFDRHRTLYTYHHTASESTLAPESAKHVTNDTVYRIGSTSKLVTVYAFLAAADSAHWRTPVTKYIPGLAERTKTCLAKRDPVDCFYWNEVTPETLASHLAGIPDGFEPIDKDPTALGGVPKGLLPPSILSEAQQDCNGQVGEIANCLASTYENGLANQHPVFRPWSQPSYSNGAFQLLAAALENITNNSFPDILQATIFEALNMTNSFSSLPPASVAGIIPFNSTISAWNQSFVRGGPEGGLYSSTADLVKLGQSIMNHDLLSPVQTRRWMKPIAHTASLRESVGAPWEILRQSPRKGDTLHSVDLYTKAGDIGLYHANLALIPEYDVGYILLSAGGPGLAIDNAVSDILLNGFDDIAHKQARRNLARKYSYCGDSEAKSSLVLAVEDGAPGLNVTTLRINGTDFRQVLMGSQSQLRAYPMGLSRKTKHGTVVTSWRMLVAPGPYSKAQQQEQELQDAIWVFTSPTLYGYTSLDELLIETDKDGKALSVEVRVLDATFV